MVSPLFEGIDLFAGSGGLSLGAQLAGISVTTAVEENPWAAQTYRLNHPETRVIQGDIRQINPPRFQMGKKKILFGGPPCQGFSTSNQRTRNSANPKNWLFGEFFRFASALKPHWIVIENVKGLRQTEKGKFEALITGEISNLGYSTDVWLLCAADYGVPQRRHRLFIIGKKRGLVPPPPQPVARHLVTVKQAIDDLPKLNQGANVDELSYPGPSSSEYSIRMRNGLFQCTGHLVTANNAIVNARYPHIPQGGNWRDIPMHLMENYTNLVNSRSRHTGIYRRLKWDTPSIVIANYRKNMLIHPVQDRGLSVREAARLQSFPDSYQFSGSIGFRQQQVSNAVPPELARVVFNHLINHS